MVIALFRPLLTATLWAVLLLTGVATADTQPPCDGFLFATSFDGQDSAGSKDALIAAARRGQSIRVGWEIDFDADGVGDLMHWADAAFLSIWKGEVFTQVNAVHAQSPVQATDRITLNTSFAEWRGSLGSDGSLEGSYSDGRVFPDGIQAKITWCLASGSQPSWVLLYRNDAQGNRLAGSREALLAAIRSGQPIQIAWGFSAERNEQRIAVEHLVAPVFLSITDETHVVAQLPEHIAQRHYLDMERALFDDPAVMWRGLMTTEGTFDAVWVNRATGEQIRRSPQRATLSWFAPASPNLDTPTLAAEGGVQRDDSRAEERFPQ